MPRKPKETKVPKQSQKVGEWPPLKLTEKWWFTGKPDVDFLTKMDVDQTIPAPISKDIYENTVKYLDKIYPHFADYVDLYRKAKLMPVAIELPAPKSNPDNDLRLNTFGLKRYRDHEQREAFMTKASELRSAIWDITYLDSDIEPNIMDPRIPRLLESALEIWGKFLHDKLFPTQSSQVLWGQDPSMTKEDHAKYSNECLAFFCHKMLMKQLGGDIVPIKRFQVRLVFD
ncbi:MAG: hypothetical protein JNJ43_03515 [Anaerolineales bacterium]|nr:hypothetical protein [Anaerolineales bacterium]